MRRVSPLEGAQHFGELHVDGGSGVLTVRLLNQHVVVLFTRDLQPAAATR